jgi:hypothetical protein
MVLIIPNAHLVSIHGTSGGQQVVNVIGVTGSFESSLGVATKVNTAWKAANGPLAKMAQQYTLVEVKAMDISSAVGEVYTLPSSGTGGSIGNLATNAACALITYGAGTRAKSQRGRLYFGPLQENMINSDGRTLATPQTFTDAFNVFKNSLTNAGLNWCVLSRKNSTATGIIQLGTQSVIATQRRRIR